MQYPLIRQFLLLIYIFIFESILSIIIYKPQCRRYISSYNKDLSKQKDNHDPCINDPYNACRHIGYLSHTWVEVSRLSLSYISENLNWNRNWFTDESEIYGWNEGYSRGFPGSEIYNLSFVPYGCWFHIAL